MHYLLSNKMLQKATKYLKDLKRQDSSFNYHIIGDGNSDVSE